MATKAFVRTRTAGNTWVDWNDRLGGGPDVFVREHYVEVSAPQGMILSTRTIIFEATTATMWLDSVGWAGTPLGRKDCIHLHIPRGKRWIDIAITPEATIEDVWNALLLAGIRERP